MAIRLSYALSSIPIVAVAVASVSINSSYLQPIITPDDTGSRLQVEASIIPTRPLTAQDVLVEDSPAITVNKSFISDETVTLSEGIDQFDIELVKADSVTAVESRVKVFTDFIDFDPSDDDVDATPVTISEAATFDLSKNFSGADGVTPSESTAKSPNKPGITASVSTSEAIDQFRPHKNITDTATTSEAIDRFDVTTAIDDTVTATESLTKDFTLSDPNDSVTVVQSNIKTFTSNVDFDLSDADVDPDPVTASDAINEFDFSKGLTDTSSITEATAKNFTHGGFSDTASPVESTAFNVTVPGIGDSLTAVEGIKNNPDIVKSDSVSPSDSINSFNVTSSLSDTLNTPTDAIDSFTINLAKSDTVTMTETVARNYTLVEDFDRTDADADPDPVTVTESIAFNQSAVFSNTLSPTESITQFAITTVHSDTASVTESINTSLILGESTYQYPSRVYMFDSTTEESSIRGYHRGFGEAAGSIFTQDGYRHRITDFTGILGNDDSLLNTTPILQDTEDAAGVDEFVGIIGSAGLVNQPRINGDEITYAETSSAGLLVNFIYTDTDDTELGGHYLNETPLCAGSYT